MFTDLSQVLHDLIVAFTPFVWHRPFEQFGQALSFKHWLNVREDLSIPIEWTLFAQMPREKMIRGKAKV